MKPYTSLLSQLSFKFIGSADELPENGSVGDICAIPNPYKPSGYLDYMYDGTKWVEIDDYVDTQEPTHIHLPTNCVNCGAPLTSHKCSFCGTEYND